jgi:hypothetical protein
VIKVTLVGPDNTQSAVTIRGDATVRDVVTTKYDLFGCLVKRNGIYVSPFTTPVIDGDRLTVEEVQYKD